MKQETKIKLQTILKWIAYIATAIVSGFGGSQL